MTERSHVSVVARQFLSGDFRATDPDNGQLATGHRSGRRSRRDGAILFCVLVCLGIATAIVMISVRSSVRVRRQMRQELQLEQTRWLLAAGLDRALVSLSEQPNYQGESWQVSPALNSYPEASVEIKLSSDDVPIGKLRLQVTAKLRGGDLLSDPIQRSSTSIVRRPDSTTDNP